MVFRGKPSKACERCRARRLRCDLKSDTCSQCIRASVPCAYRRIQPLRIENESQSVARKASKDTSLVRPKSLSLSIDLQARDAFFAYYVHGTCWDFLRQFYHPIDCPDHLTFAIEAVSLAYLWHQVYSDAALAAARERYVTALRTTNKALRFSIEASKETTLVASLLLDLFEKITDSEPRNNEAWQSHVNGALALVKVRGLQQFQQPSEFRVLLRLGTNFVLGYIASSLPVPNELLAVRDYVRKKLNVKDPMQRFSELMVQYARIRSDIKRGILSEQEYIRMFVDLEAELSTIDLDMPPSWQYTTIPLEATSDRAFDLYYDAYPHRNICLAWNILRTVRILLNESLIGYYSTLHQDDKYLALIGIAQEKLKRSVSEICASVQQYVDCNDTARWRLPAAEKLDSLDQSALRPSHPHTPNHQADCYTLLLPLYAAGRAKAVPDVRPWVVRQLHYMGSHFFIRNAEVVAQLLERGADLCPWEVYAMLGSYAFTV